MQFPFNQLNAWTTVKKKFLDTFQADISESLLETIDCRILVRNNKIYHLETGKFLSFENNAGYDLPIDVIAELTAELIQAPNMRIALFLPATEFAFTPYQIPGVKKSQITSALTFQQEELLPCCEQELQVAVNHNEKFGAINIALWFSQQRSDAFYQAFAEKKLSLVAISPSIFSKRDEFHHATDYFEQTEHYSLYVNSDKDRLVEWKLFYHADFHFSELKQQCLALAEIRNNAETLTLDDENIKQFPESAAILSLPYVFIPEKAKDLKQKRSRLKTDRLAMIAALVVIVLASVPFIKNQMNYSRAKANFEQAYQQSAEVRKLKAFVLQSEDEWASYQQFPVVNIVELLRKIDQITPKNSWLMSFSYNQGKVEVQGNSANPSELLQLISQQTEFKSVAFSQTTRSDRGKQNKHFGITFGISHLDYEKYKTEFFPDLIGLD